MKELYEDADLHDFIVAIILQLSVEKKVKKGSHLIAVAAKHGRCAYCNSIGKDSDAGYCCAICDVYLHKKCFDLWNHH